VEGTITVYELNAFEEHARDFAEKAHGAQLYGDVPYVAHLAAVREVLHDAGIDGTDGLNGELVTAAWLHDVVEDTAVRQKDVEYEFGPGVDNLVWAVTGKGVTREDRLACAYAKIQHIPGAIKLKLADRIANVEASADGRNPKMLALYAREYPGFKAALENVEATDPVVMGLWARLARALG
jgi:(p)ppGpp synthase/HD superfamily hydrolase